VEVLEELGNEPLVVFAQSRKLIMLAAQKLTDLRVSHRLLVGGLTVDEREVAVCDFQEGRARVILLTSAGGEGITLTRASHMLFLQRSWSMLANKQAEDRVHRIGSEIHETVHIIDLIAPGTVEEGQIDSLHMKFERLQQIVRDKEILRAAQDFAALQVLEAEEAAIMGGDI
jgi:SNF2 family DNA or RNA helicase